MSYNFPSWTSRVRVPSPFACSLVYSEFSRPCEILHALPPAVLRDDLSEGRLPYSRCGFPVGRETVRVEAERDVLVSMAEALTDNRERRSVAEQYRRMRVA